MPKCNLIDDIVYSVNSLSAVHLSLCLRVNVMWESACGDRAVGMFYAVLYLMCNTLGLCCARNEYKSDLPVGMWTWIFIFYVHYTWIVCVRAMSVRPTCWNVYFHCLHNLQISSNFVDTINHFLCQRIKGLVWKRGCRVRRWADEQRNICWFWCWCCDPKQ